MHDESPGPREEQGQRLRVALIGCTGVLGDIIRNAVIGEGDMDVVVDTTAPSRDDDWQAFAAVDIVVWNNADQALLEEAMAAFAQQTPPVLTAVDDGRRCELWQLAPSTTTLAALSPASLVHRIRSAARPPAAPHHRGHTTTKESRR